MIDHLSIGDEPAYPEIHVRDDPEAPMVHWPGMTKREAIAMSVLSALVQYPTSRRRGPEDHQGLEPGAAAMWAVRYADALVAELDRTGKRKKG